MYPGRPKGLQYTTLCGLGRKPRKGIMRMNPVFCSLRKYSSLWIDKLGGGIPYRIVSFGSPCISVFPCDLPNTAGDGIMAARRGCQMSGLPQPIATSACAQGLFHPIWHAVVGDVTNLNVLKQTPPQNSSDTCTPIIVKFQRERRELQYLSTTSGWPIWAFERSTTRCIHLQKYRRARRPFPQHTQDQSSATPV